MLDADGLNVWNNQRLVGYLWRNTQGQIGFRYDDAWLIEGDIGLSNTLPLQRGEFSPEAGFAHRFFANLLPEGSVRDQIVRNFKIANTDFDLLRAIGGECAGAFSVLPVKTQPLVNYEYHRLSDKELANLVVRRGQVFAWSDSERPRLSLAGAQNKCPLLVENGVYWVPKKESPSSHILKFELSDYANLPAYESFTTLLAAAVGLPVVDFQLRSIAGIHYGLIARYDRIVDSQNKIVRLHQEDFCQALGFGHERKYQEDGGPSFADCYALLQSISTDPAIDLQHLLRWQIFNVLAGNSDGHAKNLSLLYFQNGGVRLAPFYDLVCTRAIERIDYHLALSVGEERNPTLVSRKHWDSLAQQCGLRPRFLYDMVQDVATKLVQQLIPTRDKFASLYGDYPALQRIEQLVSKQCQRTLNQ